MILSFSTKLNGKETYFVEKIWQSFPDEFTIDNFDKYFNGFCELVYDFNCDAIDFLPKNHTIREDKNNRWKSGVNIDFFINARTKNMFRFAPTIPVVSTQKIEFKEIDQESYVILIDGKTATQNQIEMLAVNDGFDSTKEFLEYFPIGFTGKIIHWTDLKY